MPKNTKNVSERKLQANEENAKKSSGPKTPKGKRYSGRNAVKHGLFSKQLITNEKDRPAYDDLLMEIIEERAPATTLQFITCEEIVNCTWRVRNSMLFEQKQLKTLLEKEVETSAGEARAPNWYGVSRPDRRNYESLLSHLYQDVRENAGIHVESYKKSLIAFSGNTRLYELLTEWAPQNPDAVLLSEHLIRHAEKFKRPLPDDLIPADKDVKNKLNRMNWEFVLKLIEQEMQHVCHWDHAIKQWQNLYGPDQQHVAGLDTVARYCSAARRDLDRAIERYLRVKEAGL